MGVVGIADVVGVILTEDMIGGGIRGGRVVC